MMEKERAPKERILNERTPKEMIYTERIPKEKIPMGDIKGKDSK